MNLEELRSMLTESTEEYWYVLSGSSNEYVLVGSDDTGSRVSEAYWHDREHIAVNKADVRLRIVWGGPWENIDVKAEFGDECSFPNMEPKGNNLFHCDIYWDGALVERCSMVQVDGGRAIIPHGPTRGSLQPYELSLARSLHIIGHASHDFDDYLTRAGLG